MVWSTQRRWQRGWIAGAGLVCLGAGSFLVSGCTTPLTADLNAPSKKNQQVAKSSRSSAGKRASQKIASKEPSGKARVSDLDDSNEIRIAARKSAPRPDGSKRPAAETRREQAQVASAARDSTPSRTGASNSDARVVASKQRKSGATSASTPRGPSQIATRARPDKASIQQTSGNGQPPTIASSTKRKPAESKPAVAQRSDAESLNADAGTNAASNHERRRADRLMERAHERYQSGYPEEALRLASVAYELEKSGQSVYALGEERPSDYIMWLQSVDAVEGDRKPMIRPQHAIIRQPANTAETVAANASTRTELSDRRRPANSPSGNLIPGKTINRGAGSNVSPLADLSADSTTATRSNNGVKLSEPEAPRFTFDNQPNSLAEANAGQLEVPVPPNPRSADSSLAMTTGSNLVSPALPAASPTVVTADRTEEIAPPAPAPNLIDKHAEPPRVALAASENSQSESDSFAENETPSLVPAQTTQLTIASLVGLVTGVAGMFGLSWWRRQERRHYAAGK